MWAKHPSFKEIIERAFVFKAQGNAMFKLMQKLKASRKPLKQLHRDNFHNIL